MNWGYDDIATLNEMPTMIKLTFGKGKGALGRNYGGWPKRSESNGFYKNVRIVLYANQNLNSETATLDPIEIGATMTVEVGHWTKEMIQIKEEKGYSPSPVFGLQGYKTTYDILANRYINYKLNYRRQHGLPIEKSDFGPVLNSNGILEFIDNNKTEYDEFNAK